MRKRARLAVALLMCLLAALFLVLVLNGRSEPSSNGYPLRHWLAMQAKLEREWEGSAPRPPDDNEEQVQAVRHIGTNALPCLLSWISYEPPLLKTEWRDFRRRARKHTLGRWLPDPGIEPWPPDPPELACCGFKILGEQASSAIPSLARLANDPSTKENTACVATHALGYIGPRALPELVSALTNRSAVARLQGVFILRRFGTNALPAVPALLDCFRDTNEDVAMIAMTAIHESCLHQNNVFTALVNSLQDPRGKVRESALSPLSRSGPRAVPILERALNDPDFGVRFRAIALLLQSNPMGLTNAPVFAAVTSIIYSDQSFRHIAVEFLSSFGKSVPEQAIPILTSLLQDKEKLVRMAATNALLVLKRLSKEGTCRAVQENDAVIFR